MKGIVTIARVTFLEIVRSRILYSLVFFCLILMLLSVAIGELSFAEQKRIILDWSLTALHLVVVVLSLLLGSQLLAQEQEKRTIMILLIRPLSRAEFLLGKAFGLMWTVVVVIAGFSFVIFFLAPHLVIGAFTTYLETLFGMVAESIILISFVLCMSTLFRPVMAFMTSFSFFLMGHWLDRLDFLATASSSESFKVLNKVFHVIFPNLERFNWRSLLVYGDVLPEGSALAAFGYSMGWGIFLLGTAILVIGRKDLA